MGGIYLRTCTNIVPTILVILYGSVLAARNQSDQSETNLTLSTNNTQNSTDLGDKTNFTIGETNINGTESFSFTENDALNTTTEETSTRGAEEATTPKSFWAEYSTFQRDDVLACVCDLLPSACDVNCCCDKQCSEDDRRVFTSCGMPIPKPDERYCYQENPIFINNTPYVMYKTSSNLFCIATDNNQGRLRYKDIQTITSDSQFQQVAEKYLPYSWPEQSEGAITELKVGTPVYIQFEDDSIGYLSLPTNLVTGECLSSNPAAYLINAENNCHQIIKDLKSDCTDNEWLSSRTYFQGFKIVRDPDHLKNASYVPENLLQVTAELCVNILEVDVVCNATDEADFPLPSFDESSRTCNSAVNHVKYEITHNGTQGIYSALVKITLGSIEGSEVPASPSTKWMQKHSVVFNWAKENSSSTSQMPRSGNPGYRVGAKVLAGKLVSEDIGEGTSKDARIGVRLSQDDNNWLTVLGASPFQDNLCISQTQGSVAGSGRFPIVFGQDVATGCQLVVSLQNLTDMCGALQSVALDSLMGWDPPTVVGAYGNSNVSNPGEWVPILVQNRPSASRPVGKVACTNIVRELHIRILHSNIGSLANPQAKIVGIQYRFGAPNELKIRCVGRYCQSGAEKLTQKYPVMTTVAFVDISEPATPVYAEKPTIRMQLPNDFFYPFISPSTVFRPNRFIIIPAFITAIVFYLKTNR